MRGDGENVMEVNTLVLNRKSNSTAQSGDSWRAPWESVRTLHHPAIMFASVTFRLVGGSQHAYLCELTPCSPTTPQWFVCSANIQRDTPILPDLAINGTQNSDTQESLPPLSFPTSDFHRT